ncbi:MAG: type II toxin-antitoxin system VapB family antitoxin [Geminicoccaceae bacterium]|nr:type II toxin-antitoxin system VapB family antitoxin [Geminicoccaceae bacterium]
MPLYIRDERIKALAEEVARLQGTTMTEAVRASLAEARRRIEADRDERRARADAALTKLQQMVKKSGKPLDENTLYDDQGNPIL